MVARRSIDNGKVARARVEKLEEELILLAVDYYCGAEGRGMQVSKGRVAGAEQGGNLQPRGLDAGKTARTSMLELSSEKMPMVRVRGGRGGGG